MKGLFGYEITGNDKPKAQAWNSPARSNPMIEAYGQYPDPNVKCKDCVHLVCFEYSRRYFKCTLRGTTHDTSTDHRKHWPACSKFKKQ